MRERKTKGSDTKINTTECCRPIKICRKVVIEVRTGAAQVHKAEEYYVLQLHFMVIKYSILMEYIIITYLFSVDECAWKFWYNDRAKWSLGGKPTLPKQQ